MSNAELLRFFAGLIIAGLTLRVIVYRIWLWIITAPEFDETDQKNFTSGHKEAE